MAFCVRTRGRYFFTMRPNGCSGNILAVASAPRRDYTQDGMADRVKTPVSGMRLRQIGLAIITLALIGAGAARADNLAAFNLAMEDVAAHNRAAIEHLRNHDPDLAKAELARMQASWGALAEKFSRDRPDALRDNKLYVTMLVDVPTRIVTALIMINFGRPDIATNSLQAIRQEMSAVRRDAGVEVLADGVLDADARMEALAAYADQPPAWDDIAAVRELAAKAEAFGAAVRHCDALAPEPVRTSAEFRRALDGVTASLDALAQAIAARDAGALHRVIMELRSFDMLLASRYG
jgi:hypothetical protein